MPVVYAVAAIVGVGAGGYAAGRMHGIPVAGVLLLALAAGAAYSYAKGRV